MRIPSTVTTQDIERSNFEIGSNFTDSESGCLHYASASLDYGHEEHVMNAKLDRITVNPNVMNGQPCIRGMRLTVRRVLQAIALYPDRTELKAEYPELEDDDISQALEFAARNLDDMVLPVEAA
jgi:uncharacterized protein (DUF433 family)